MQPIFHWLTLGFRIGGNANLMFCIGGNANLMFCIVGNTSFSVFRYQHVSIPNAKFSCWGCYPMPDPNAKGLALRWNIGLRFSKLDLQL